VANFTGTNGDDVQSGTALDDVFNYSQGGKDRLNGAGGNDIFRMGGALTAADRIDGGKFQTDVVIFDGAYNDFVLGAKTLVDIEELRFKEGHDYDITIHDAMAASNPNVPFIVDASRLGAEDVFEFHGESETDANLVVTSGAGNDVILTGDGSDFAYGGAGGDTVFGFGARDVAFGGDGGDALDGGVGEDVLRGDRGMDILNGSADGDHLYGGAGRDALNGGDGADSLDGGPAPTS
jgi:Ca2+-binding RTX toxin-like protein